MKIAVCGSGSGDSSKISEISKRIGMGIAKCRHTLVTGGCRGYPYAALRGALLENGKVTVYSPAKDKEEHLSKYKFPIDEGVEYIFTGKGIPERNIDIIRNSDIIIFINGQIGTLNEFTLAFKLGKKMFVLNNSGGISALMPEISKLCGDADITYIESERELVKSLI